MPTYSGDVRHECALSLIEVSEQLSKADVDHLIEFVPGMLITAARNKLATKVLREGFTHLLFVDADIGFHAQLVLDMIAAERDFVACTYLKRELPEAPRAPHESVSKWLEGAGKYAVVPHSNTRNEDITEVSRVGLGLALIRNGVFEIMQPKCKQYDLDGVQIEFFRLGVVGNEFRTEDYDFCERWRKLGGGVFVLTQADTTHTGPITLRGCYSAALDPDPS
ncbi:hypothetical protein [Bradyrhizobium murdochi]|uniref:hypothetical protein n=1 Tax=Bradyrhizobium murdochi TaxID=1038859 RepID=UPI0012EC3887|nr:hypothetical protein [Bradyrhizobium murdochi]